MTRVRRFTSSVLVRNVAGYVLVAVIFAAAWLWSLSGPLTDAVIGQQERNLTAVAQSAALNVMQSQESPGQIARQLVARTDVRLTIVAADGVVVADSDADPATMDNHGDRPEVIAALQGEVGKSRRASKTEGTEQLYVAVPGTLDGRRVVVRVSQPLDEIQRIAARSRRVGIVLLTLALAVSLAVAIPAARAASRPIEALSEAAEAMAAGNLAVRIPDVPADLEVLASALATLREQMRTRIEALEAERRTLRTTLDGLSDAVLLLDGDRVRLVNESAASLVRAAQSPDSAPSLDDLGLPASLVAAVRERIASGDTAASDLEPEPTGRTLRLAVAPLGKGTEGERAVVVISDVTERARLDRVRRDFVANASHELKTPVAGIGLLADSAATAAADGDAEQAVLFARQIAGETRRLQQLVGDLLDLSRLETTPQGNALADVRVAVENALVSHSAAASRAALTLSADFSAVRDIDVYAAADVTDVAVALDNLIDNAIAYTEAGSVTVTITADESAVAIVVADTGSGIPTDALPRIFERFYRVDAGRSRESGGTGLGLALVRHVAERNGGTISVDSQPGRGSTFTLVLPRAT